MTKNNLKQVILVIAVVFCVTVIFSFSLQSGSLSHHESSILTALIRGLLARLHIQINSQVLEIYRPFIINSGDIDFEEFVRKTAHVFEYSLLGILTVVSYLAAKKDNCPHAILMLVGPLVALFDERVIQRYLVANRTSSFKDVLLDSISFYLAFGLGYLLTTVCHCCRKRRRGAGIHTA